MSGSNGSSGSSGSTRDFAATFEPLLVDDAQALAIARTQGVDVSHAVVRLVWLPVASDGRLLARGPTKLLLSYRFDALAHQRATASTPTRGDIVAHERAALFAPVIIVQANDAQCVVDGCRGTVMSFDTPIDIRTAMLSLFSVVVLLFVGVEAVRIVLQVASGLARVTAIRLGADAATASVLSAILFAAAFIYAARRLAQMTAAAPLRAHLAQVATGRSSAFGDLAVPFRSVAVLLCLRAILVVQLGVMNTVMNLSHGRLWILDAVCTGAAAAFAFLAARGARGQEQASPSRAAIAMPRSAEAWLRTAVITLGLLRGGALALLGISALWDTGLAESVTHALGVALPSQASCAAVALKAVAVLVVLTAAIEKEQRVAFCAAVACELVAKTVFGDAGAFAFGAAGVFVASLRGGLVKAAAERAARFGFFAAAGRIGGVLAGGFFLGPAGAMAGETIGEQVGEIAAIASQTSRGAPA